MTWIYKNEAITDEQIPPKSIGFVYLITHNPSGRKYIGRKLLTKAKRTQKNGKVKRIRVESDWKDYWSSSPELVALVESESKEQFTREILIFTMSKSEMNYVEESLQYYLGVLESDEWINSNIRSKIFKRIIKGKPAIQQMRDLIRDRFLSTT
jgi:serine/threonine protein kinase